MGLYKNLGLYVYNSDDGTTYNVGITAQEATAGGFTAAAAGEQADFPKAWRMRYVLGYYITGTGVSFRKLPIASNTNPLYTGDQATFTITDNQGGSFTYTRTGEFGEKRANRI